MFFGEVTIGGVAALVLAGGASRRAGSLNKLLYPVAGEPMVRRVARRVRDSAVDDVVVVTGHDAEAVGAALEGLDVRRVHNAAHASGMASSLTRALGSVLEHDAVLVCLGDMPGISPALIARLLEARLAVAASERARTIVLPVNAGRRGNPVLIGRAFFDLLLALEGDVGARALIRAHPEAVREVAVDDPAVLVDHDTVEALRALDAC